MALCELLVYDKVTHIKFTCVYSDTKQLITSQADLHLLLCMEKNHNGLSINASYSWSSWSEIVVNLPKARVKAFLHWHVFGCL